jgi:hypothetical protein
VKINDLMFGRITHGDPSAVKETTKGDAFAKVLDQTQSKNAAETTTMSKSGHMSSLMDIDPVARIMAARSQGLNQSVDIEKTLNSLERFAGALADPNQTLKHIAPLADELASEAETLDRAGKSIPDDHPLKPVIEQTAVLAAVESAKFKRGDYI